MKKGKEKKLSVYISKILRHETKLEFDENSYVDIEELINYIRKDIYWDDLKRENIENIVKECKKQRYSIKGNKIKANYGHSNKKGKYLEKKPPKFLLHGTSKTNFEKIKLEGLKKMQRDSVHMSEGEEFAILAGKRKGDVVILEIDSEKAFNENVKFYYAGNEVWLTEFVDIKYIKKRE